MQQMTSDIFRGIFAGTLRVNTFFFKIWNLPLIVKCEISKDISTCNYLHYNKSAVDSSTEQKNIFSKKSHLEE